MNIDLTLIPATFDGVHAGLAAIIICLLILQTMFLTITVNAMLRRREPAPVAAPEPVKVPEPAPVVEKLAAPEPGPARVEVRTETVVVKEASPDAALQLLGLLQKEARFVDFTQENMGDYSDEEIGAVARVVQEGCRKVLGQYFTLAPVRNEEEGKRITLQKGFDASSIRLTGNIVGQPPFTGSLVHRGWKAAEIKLPKITEGHDSTIIAAAEVEL